MFRIIGGIKISFSIIDMMIMIIKYILSTIYQSKTEFWLNVYFIISVTRTYGEENLLETKKSSHLHGVDESAANVRLPYILNNLPPYTGPPSHSILKKSNNDLTDLKRDYHLITTSTTTSSTTSSTLAPYIDPTTPTNVTVIRGKTAMLVCVVTDLGTAKVGV